MVADFIEFRKGKSGEAFAIAGVVMGLPTDGNATRRGRDFEEDDASILSLEFVNFPECGGRFTAIRDLLFEAVEPLSIRSVAGADDFACAVFHAEHEPSRSAGAQVCFIAKGGKVLTYIGCGVALPSFLELHAFTLPAAD